MLVLASSPRAPCVSSTSIAEWSVRRGVSGRLWSAFLRVLGWTGATTRPPDDSRTHDIAVSDRDEVALTAHDCLTLLAIMVRCADAMRHPAAEDDFLECRRAADRIDRLVHQLISPRQPQTEMPDFIDLGELIAESEGMLKRSVAPGVSLRLEPGAIGWARIQARRWDLERMLLHVVIYAARGIASGGVVIATSSGENPGSSVSLIVTGSRSASTSAARLSPRSSAENLDETDLGLAAVARLVQRLNGVLQFESDSERRTRIQVDFPFAGGDSEDNPP